MTRDLKRQAEADVFKLLGHQPTSPAKSLKLLEGLLERKIPRRVAARMIVAAEEPEKAGKTIPERPHPSLAKSERPYFQGEIQWVRDKAPPSRKPAQLAKPARPAQIGEASRLAEPAPANTEPEQSPEPKQSPEPAQSATESDDTVLRRFGIAVRLSQTTPKRAGKQPRPVYLVQGDTRRVEEILRGLGGHRWKGDWSFWEDPKRRLASLLGEGLPSFEETIATKQERAARRAERLDNRASKARAEGSARIGKARSIGDMIPLGEPIKIGHHSQRRHERDIERIRSNYAKGYAALDEAKELADRAAYARAAADGSIYGPKYYLNRVKEREAEIRSVQREIKRYGDTERRRQRIAALTEEQAYYQAKLDEATPTKLDASTIKKGSEVQLSNGLWYRVRRVNPQSVSVAYGVSPLLYNRTIPYALIAAHREAGAQNETR